MLIAQLTDTHVTVDGRQAADLSAALAWINALRPRPALILISGDTVNDGRPEQYARLRDVLAGSAIPTLLVPGNHDRRPAFRATLPPVHFPGVTGESIAYVLETLPVRILGLDTTAPGRPGGILASAQLDWLDLTLAGAPQRPTLLFMHHPPFRTGVNLADMFGFAGQRRFAALVARHRHVRRIVAGHVHCRRSATIANALVTTAISSTPQVVPELFERRLIGLRSEPAGFTLHAWRDDAFTSTTYIQAPPAAGGGFSAAGSP